MDKSKWEYKKLGEVCSKLTDGSHNPPKGIENSDYRMISSQNIFNDKIVLNDYRYLSKEDFETEDKRTALKKGDLLLTIVGAIGRCYVLNGTEGNLTLQRSVAALTPKDTISSRFLMYYFIGNNANLLEEAHGAAQKGIYLRQLSNLIVPVPTLDDQQRIVAELDCLNEMIALKQEQLKEFDKLAQSIFYDMFGDPVSNEKGWQIKKIGDVASFYNGKAHENDIDENGEFVLINAKFIASDGMILKRTNKQLFPLFENDIVMVMSDVPNGKALARCFLIKHNNIYSLNQRICAFRDYSLNSIFLLFLLNRNKYYLRFDDGNGQTNLRKNDVLGCPVILPPLALQQQFAEKIQAIEAQKELVKKSIAETQQLLDSRMDYYFD